MSKIVNMKSAAPAEIAAAVRIDRATRWGNPFRIGPDGDRPAVIAKYCRHLWASIRNGAVKLEELAELDGKILACWCAPAPCHGDVLSKAARWAADELARA